MKHTAKRALTYCGLALVFAMGLYAASRPDVGESVRILAGNSAICSLLGAAFLLVRDDISFERKLIRDELEHERALLRDEIAHERNLKKQDSEKAFEIGTTSHMAKVAFDKHVLFCEEYVGKTSEIASKLFQRGPHEEAINYASELFGIRTKWVIWVTPETEHALEPFERAVRSIGADAMLLASGAEMQNRHAVVKSAYAVFSEVLGIRDFEKDNAKGEQAIQERSERAVEAVIGKLRDALGVETLSDLRSKLLEQASKNLKG